MGLESVEIVMATEDAFQISIEDKEAAKVNSVGDLYDLVVSKLRGFDAKRCLTSVAFYRTRRCIIDTLGIERRQITPSTVLTELLPRQGRRSKWKKIEESLPLKLPPLRFSGATLLTLLLIGIVLAMLPGIRSHAGFDVFSELAFYGLFIGLLLIKCSPALAVAFPNGDKTVGDLVGDILALNHAKLAAEFSSCNKKEVWEIIKKIVVEHLGVDPKKVTPEAKFVDDLGMA